MRHGRFSAVALAVVAGFCAFAFGVPAQQANPPIEVKQLKGDVYWAEGGGGNTGFIVGKDGVLVIDAKTTPESAKSMLESLQKITPKPVTHAIITHSDADHVNGLAAFPKGIAVITQVNCKKEMEESLKTDRPAPADYMPTHTVDKKESMTLNGIRIEFLHWAPAHTSGDLVVYLPQQKVVFTGDIITTNREFPLIHLEKNGSSEGWFTTVKGILALDADTFVPGHGDIQTRADIQNLVAKSQERHAKVVEMAKAGKSLDAIKAALPEKNPPPAPGARGFAGYDEVVYREVTKTTN